MPLPDPLDIEALLATRELARRNYRDFMRYYIEVSRSTIRWSWYLEYLCDVMQAATAGHIKRLIINIPPRHAKSTTISQLYQAWRIGRDNSDNSSMLSCAASLVLAARDSRKTLNTIRSDWYQALFPGVDLLRENEVDWETRAGARRMAVGRGGTVIGRGANTIVWDDLLKSDEGMSEVERPKCNEWLGEVLASRLDDPKHGLVVGIMQRLHELDPTGYLLEQSKIPGADQYEHICIPLEAPHVTQVDFGGKHYKTRQKDELIDEERIGKQEVTALKISMRANFEGQYNQNPIKMIGGHLDTTQLIYSHLGPLDLQQHLGLTPLAFIDLAATEKQVAKDDPDESTISICARDQFNRLVILDVWGKQTSHEEVANTLIQMHKLWRFRCALIEKGGLYNLFSPVLRTRLRATGHYLSYDALPNPNSLGDKIQRSMSFQAMLNAGAVVVPKAANSPWLEHFLKQARSFPRGRHDDRLEGAFYAAITFDSLPRGESAPTNPDTNATIDEIQQRQMKQRIQEMVDREKNPPVDNDGW